MIAHRELTPEEMPPDCGHAQHQPPPEAMKIPGSHIHKCPGCGLVLSFIVYAKDPEQQ